MGCSGAGKSSLALQLIGLGATLVSDDLTHLSNVDGVLIAKAPRQLAGVIEARFVGLLKMPYQDLAAVHLVVDMDRDEKHRLPRAHKTNVLGVRIDTYYKVAEPHFPIALKSLILGGRYDG